MDASKVPNHHLVVAPKEGDLVQNILDYSSFLLSPTGLDVIPDAIGFIYAQGMNNQDAKVKYLAGIMLAEPSQWFKGIDRATIRKFIKNYRVRFNTIGMNLPIPEIKELFDWSVARKLDEKFFKKVQSLKLSEVEIDLLNEEFKKSEALIKAMNVDATFLKVWTDISKIKKGELNVSPVQRITNKYPDEGFPKDGKLYGVAKFTGGKIKLNEPRHIPNEVDFVVTLDGKLLLGKKHHLIGLKNDVQAAGTFKIANGKIKRMDNASGHYFPTLDEGFKFPDILRGLGAELKGTSFELLALDKKGNVYKAHSEYLK